MPREAMQYGAAGGARRRASNSEIAAPVEYQSHADRVHGIEVYARCASWIDHAPMVRNVHAAEELQDQLGGLGRVECAIRAVLENREVEIGRLELDHSRSRSWRLA